MGLTKKNMYGVPLIPEGKKELKFLDKCEYCDKDAVGDIVENSMGKYKYHPACQQHMNEKGKQK